jgi:predicted flavoprotein YhiN
VDCLSEVEAVARHDAVTTADGNALASSLQNNGEQCITAIWNVFGGNDMITTCGMSGSATMDLSKLVNDKQSPKYDTGAQGL